MGARVSIKPFAPSFTVSSNVGPQSVAAFHRAKVAEAVAIDTEATGQAPTSTTFVNGVQSDALETVRPGQAIVTIFDLSSDLLQHVYDLLVLASPTLTGRFRRSIAIFADGQQVASVDDALGATEVVFTSTVPYARKIERGESDQAPDGVFEGVAAILQKRYANQAKIRFGYVNPIGDMATDLAKWSAGRGERSRRERQRDTRQPATIVTF